MSANEHLDSTCDLGHFVHCDGLLEAGSKFLESYDSLIVDTWEWVSLVGTRRTTQC